MKWTWTRMALLILALWLEIDAFIVPTAADPGSSGDASLAFMISWVALKRRVPSNVEALLGCGLTLGTCLTNRMNYHYGDKLLMLPVMLLAGGLFVYFDWGE